VDGTSEIVQDRVNGWLVDLDGLEENLRLALVALSQDPVLRSEFGVRAIETVSGRYNAVLMTEQIEQIYNRWAKVRTLKITKPAYHGI